MISKFDDLEKIASWNQILKDSITGTIFITPTWQETWLNNYQPQATLFLDIVTQENIDIGVVNIMSTRKLEG